MHQTFYIDIDEEITSIVERLKKAQTKEIIMVVPKRALLVQSIVNLRILKKEADEIGLQLMVVTQDKLGKILIEKAGILVQQKMDNIADEEIDLSEQNDRNEGELYDDKQEVEELKDNGGRLDKIGSANYFDEIKFKKEARKKIIEAKEKKVMHRASEKKEKIVNQELVINSQKGIKRSHQSNININAVPQSLISAEKTKQEDFNNEKLEKFFKSSEKRIRSEKNKEKKQDYAVSSKTGRRFLIFVTLFLIVIGTIGVYLFIPKVKINIISKVKSKTISSEIIGKTSVRSVDTEKGIIPAQKIEITSEFKKTYPATGEKIVSNQKARGMITIYNEYSTQPQPLVATTRFVSEDGKLFRLVKGTTVPGKTMDNGQSKAGSIKVQVVADEAGSDFNIKPTKFTIPGFKSTPSKYSKIYAQSETAMSGGGNGNQKVHIITQSDIDKAKKDAMASLNNSVKDKVRKAAGKDIILLDDAIDKKEATYKLSNSLDEIADSFQLTVNMQVTAVVVQKDELKKMVVQMLNKAGGGQIDIIDNSVAIDFGKANVDFEAGTIDMRFQAKGRITPNIDINTIKESILGKGELDVKTYLTNYPDVDKIEIHYWPSFISGRIPFQKNRVEITLDK